LKSKRCGLRSSRFSRKATQTSPFGPFPFKALPTPSPVVELDRHLVRTIILFKCLSNSLGVFLDSRCHFLASFAGLISYGPDGRPLAGGQPPINRNPLKTHSRQATLPGNPRRAPRQVFPCVLAGTSGSPRAQGHRPHAIVDRPTPFTPRIDPRLGAPSRNQELHRCALWRIFRPAFRNGGLTRILHHLIVL